MSLSPQNPVTKRQGRARNKKTTYELRVTCEKIPEMNEQDFLNLVRQRLTNVHNYEVPPVPSPVRVSVLKRIEEFTA
jgi:hypothetical protein